MGRMSEHYYGDQPAGEQSDLFGGKAARDAGVTRVADNSGDWMERALAFVRALPPDWIGTGEDIKMSIRATTFLGEPHHQNCWGSLVLTAQRFGYLRHTGKWHKCKLIKGHARNIKEYRRL